MSGPSDRSGKPINNANSQLGQNNGNSVSLDQTDYD
jgi:hypothetical protein